MKKNLASPNKNGVGHSYIVYLNKINKAESLGSGHWIVGISHSCISVRQSYNCWDFCVSRECTNNRDHSLCLVLKFSHQYRITWEQFERKCGTLYSTETNYLIRFWPGCQGWHPMVLAIIPANKAKSSLFFFSFFSFKDSRQNFWTCVLKVKYCKNRPHIFKALMVHRPVNRHLAPLKTNMLTGILI